MIAVVIVRSMVIKISTQSRLVSFYCICTIPVYARSSQ